MHILKKFQMKHESFLLKKKIRKSVFTYIQIARTDCVAIYAQYLYGRVICYEVFKIKIQKERNFDGRHFPRKEKFPSDSEFGKNAWAIRKFTQAYTKYVMLNAEIGKEEMEMALSHKEEIGKSVQLLLNVQNKSN